MEKFIVPSYVATDASNFITQLSHNQVFMNSNHDGVLLHCRMQDSNGFDLLTTEEGSPKLTKSDLKYDELVQVLKKQKWKTYVIVDNYRNSLVFVLSRPTVVEHVFLEEVGVPGQSKFHYYGEEYQMGKETTLYSVAKPCVVFKANVRENGKTCDIVIPFDDEKDAVKEAENIWRHVDGRLMFVSGMNVPMRFWSKVHGKQVRQQSLAIVVSDYWFAEDRFDDVAKYVPHIKSYDIFSLFRNHDTGELLYPDQVNKLMWYDVFYSKLGDPTLNLILCGESGSAKTHALSLYAYYFSDGGIPIDSKNSTQKGLVPSFSDDGHPGALAEAKFFVCVDEFFQLPGSADRGMNKQSDAYESYLRRLLPVLTKKEMSYPSGKNTAFRVIMRASLMGTDNIGPKTKTALQTLIHDDPAAMRRFSLAFLDKGVWSKVKQARQANDNENIEFVEEYWVDKYHIPPKALKRIAECMRMKSKNIRVDSTRVSKLIHDAFINVFLKKMYGDRLPDEKFYESIESLCRVIDYHPHVNALVRCSAVNRAFFKEQEERIPEEFLVDDEDYVVAQDVFEFMVWSMLFMFEDVFAQHIGIGGILRTG